MSETAAATTAFTPDTAIVTGGQLLVLDADERTATITALPVGTRERLADLARLGAWRERAQAPVGRPRGRPLQAAILAARAREHAQLAAQLLDY